MAEKKESKHKNFRKHIPEEAIEHAKAARAEMRKSFEALFPPEFVEHRRVARKEMLLAAREIVNSAIERLEAKEKEGK
jgi:hypothetical protein